MVDEERKNFLEEKIIKYFNAQYYYEDICDLMLKKHNFQISLRSLQRFFQSRGMKRKNMEESPLIVIVAAIYTELENSAYNLGYRAMHRRLHTEYNLIVKQKTVLKILKTVDPDGVNERKRNRLRRRQYIVPGPNFMWHMDGNDKLGRFGILIHGCIDGFSKKIMWLNVANTNKDPKVVASYFTKTVQKYKCLPTVIRSDKGTENVIVESMQQVLRYDHADEFAGFNSFRTGKSTANQRIESLWCQLRRQVTGFYINLFKLMEAKEFIDISNPVHIESLKYCFELIIKHDIQTFKIEWNKHRIRKQNTHNVQGGIPNILYYLPEKYGAQESKKKVNLDQLHVLKEKYTSEPCFCNEVFINYLNEIIPNVKQPGTVEDAFILYCNILDALQE